MTSIRHIIGGKFGIGIARPASDPNGVRLVVQREAVPGAVTTDSPVMVCDFGLRSVTGTLLPPLTRVALFLLVLPSKNRQHGSGHQPYDKRDGDSRYKKYRRHKQPADDTVVDPSKPGCEHRDNLR